MIMARGFGYNADVPERSFGVRDGCGDWPVQGNPLRKVPVGGVLYCAQYRVMSNRGENRLKCGHRRQFSPLAFPALRRPPLKALTRAWIPGRPRLQPPMHRLASRGCAWPKGAIGQALFKLVIQPKLSQCGPCLFNLLLRNPAIRGNLDFDG